MAEIRPLRAWRYAPHLGEQIPELISPLFDVVSKEQREKLYAHPLNSIHISVPQGENPTLLAKDRIAKWMQEGVLVHDEKPAIYVYYQYFNLPNSTKRYCRKGFVCNIRAYDWNEEVVLRHENTIPSAVNDRIQLLVDTHLNVSPTHGLYTDPTFSLEKMMDKAMEKKLLETEDYQGVADCLAKIDEPRLVQQFVDLLKDKKVILADGHHRYESSVFFRKKMEKENPEHRGDEGYNFHLMYLTNTESDDLRILPTHRLIFGIPDFDEESILKKAKDYFDIKPIDEASLTQEVILGTPRTFGILFKDNAYRFRLKAGLENNIPWSFPKVLNEMDLTVMHYFIIEKLLGVKGKDQRKSENIAFERNFSKCLSVVQKGQYQMGIITNEISIEQVKQVCYTGHTLPQKSTYFYPKVICGFVFSSTDDQ